MAAYHMRRHDREITDEKELEDIITKGKFVTISMCRDNEPYIVTLSYGYDKANHAFFFHCAPQGHKLDMLAANPAVCATILEDGGYVYGACSHKYRTVVLSGKMKILTDMEEKLHGLDVLLHHLETNPDAIKEEEFKKGNTMKNTAILRLDIEHITGKHGQ